MKIALPLLVTVFLAALVQAQDTQPSPVSGDQTAIADSIRQPDGAEQTAPEPLYRPMRPPQVKKSVPPEQVQKDQATAPASGRVLNSTDYIRGKMDGERDATGRRLWFFAGLPGVCCYGVGLGGILFSYLLPPSPPESVLIGKSGEYIFGYTESYLAKSRMKNLKYASLGCLTGTAAFVAVYLIAISTYLPIF